MGFITWEPIRKAISQILPKSTVSETLAVEYNNLCLVSPSHDFDANYIQGTTELDHVAPQFSSYLSLCYTLKLDILLF